MTATKNETEETLIALVAPWLPDAMVDSLDFQTECGCYSEWTTDPCYFHVTFRAPRPVGEADRTLSKIVTVIEQAVKSWADGAFHWRGCSCCCDADDVENVTPSVWVRVIPDRQPAAEGAS